MRIRTLAAALGWLVLATGRTDAQEHPNVARGLGGTGSLGTVDLDQVNHFNGNLVLRLPLGQPYPVNAGFSYQLALVYNSQVWERKIEAGQVVVIPARDSNSGLGWSLQLGRLNPPKLEEEPPPIPGDFSRNIYHAPDGSIHAFYPTLHEGETVVAGTEYTRDGSYLRLKTGPRQIEFSDGTVHTFSSLTNGFLTRMEDRFGNFVQVEYLDCPTEPSCVPVAPHLAHRWRITDRVGRTHWVHLLDTGRPRQPLVVKRVDLAAFGGARAIYKLLYNSSTDDDSTNGLAVALTGCWPVDPAVSNHIIWLLSKVVLPDGSVYDMPSSTAYFSINVPGDPNNPCKTGLLRNLRLPTLGSIDWDYRLYKFPKVSGQDPLNFATGVGQRRLLNAAGSSIGQWAFETALSGGTPQNEKLLTSTATDPLGNKVRRYFSVCVNNCTHPDGAYEYGLPIGRDAGTVAGRFVSEEYLDAAGTLVRSYYVLYEHDQPSGQAGVQEKSRLNQRLVSDRWNFHDDGSLGFGQTFANFDGLGHYRTVSMGGNFPGNNTRVEVVAFNYANGDYGQPGYLPWPASSPWVLDTYSFTWAQETGPIQFRIFCFDPATGFLLRYRTLKNAGTVEHPKDSLQIFQPDAVGNVATESLYGGDSQNLASGACGLTPPASPVYRYTHTYSGGVRATTSVQVGTALKILDLSIDASTGLPSASRDPAGKQASFTYDVLGRLAVVDPADDLFTVNTFCSATSVPACPAGIRAQAISARSPAASGGTEVTANRLRFDDWGRLVSEEERMPPAGTYVGRTMAYNALGWKTFVSERGTSFGTSFFNFDRFGRPRTVRPPDGSAHDVTLSYLGVRQVARTVKVATAAGPETNAVTTEVYDRHGRLHELTEPNGTKTRYDYDVGNRLVKVCQGATGAGTSVCGQQRLFSYDMRGFLLSEQHPEKGPSGNGLVSYLGYDAAGHPLQRVDGPNDITFVYDAAERLVQVRETGGAQRLLKTFGYASANGTTPGGLTDWRKGKLVSASRFNHVGPPFNLTAEVRDTFLYPAAEGRVGEHSRELILAGVNKEKFATTYAFDGLGLVSILGYPDCVAGDCAGLDTPRTVSFGYSFGRLAFVPGYTGTAGGVSQISYHPNGLLHQLPHANGVLFTQQNDSTGMPRPAGMTAANGSATLWTTGAYAYDGAGNVKSIGSQTFLYDSVGRLVQGTLEGGSFQQYTYDPYGNLTSINTDGSQLSIPASSTTNRLTGLVSYDAAGNLTAWNGNAYEYDAFNQMVRFHSGAEDWVYVYGADDERFWSYKVSGPGSLWALRDLSGKVLREYDAHLGWNQYEDYVYRGQRLLTGLLSNGQRRHFDLDHLGSVRLVTNTGGNPSGIHRYHPFGKEATTLQEGEQMKFTGHERDLANPAGDGDDLDYMHARFYNPTFGRFLSMDMAPPSPLDPQTFNRYAYARNNPLNFVDPDGRQDLPAGWLDLTFGLAGAFGTGWGISAVPAGAAVAGGPAFWGGGAVLFGAFGSTYLIDQGLTKLTGDDLLLERILAPHLTALFDLFERWRTKFRNDPGAELDPFVDLDFRESLLTAARSNLVSFIADLEAGVFYRLSAQDRERILDRARAELSRVEGDIKKVQKQRRLLQRFQQDLLTPPSYIVR